MTRRHRFFEEPLPKSRVPWPDKNPFPLIRARLCVYYHLRAARWFQACHQCEQPAHPISHTGIWYRCLRCQRAFLGADHEFYFDWQIFLSHHDQQMVREYFYLGNSAPFPGSLRLGSGTSPEMEESDLPSESFAPEAEQRTRPYHWDAAALEDFCLAAILSDPSMYLPLPQNYSLPFEKGRPGEVKSRPSVPMVPNHEKIAPPGGEQSEGTPCAPETFALPSDPHRPMLPLLRPRPETPKPPA